MGSARGPDSRVSLPRQLLALLTLVGAGTVPESTGLAWSLPFCFWQDQGVGAKTIASQGDPGIYGGTGYRGAGTGKSEQEGIGDKCHSPFSLL